MKLFKHARSSQRPRGWRWLGAAVAVVASLALGISACGGDDDGGGSGSGEGGERDSARIAIVQVAAVPIFDEYVEGFKNAFLKTTKLPADSVEFELSNAQGDNSLIQNFARALPREDFDQFAVIGTPAVVALSRTEKQRPILAIAITDPVGAGVAKSLEQPGGNVTGTTSTVPPEASAEFLDQLEPRPTRVGTILDPSNDASQSFVEGVRPLLEDQGMEFVEAAIAGPAEVAQATRSALNQSDLLLLGPDSVAVGAGLPGILQQAAAAEKAVVVAAAIDPATEGTLAVLGPDNEALGRVAGEQAGRFFVGEAEPATTPFYVPEADLTVHQAVAKSLGITAPDSLP